MKCILKLKGTLWEIFSQHNLEREWWVLIYMKEEGKAAAAVATENFLLLKNFILIFNVEIFFWNKMEIALKMLELSTKGKFI